MALTAEDFPVLPGYVSVARTAKIFGIAKTSVFYRIYSSRSFQHVYRIDGEDDDARPVLVLLESEVLGVKAAEDAAAEAARRAEVPFAQLLNAWNKRVKQWGMDTGWGDGHIHYRGQPNLQLRSDYLAAHPEDPKPVE